MEMIRLDMIGGVDIEQRPKYGTCLGAQRIVFFSQNYRRRT